MKSMTVLALALFTMTAFGSEKECVNGRSGEIAQISGLTLTVYNASKSKVLRELDAKSVSHTPGHRYYFKGPVNNRGKVLFEEVSVGGYTRGGKPTGKHKHFIQEGATRYKCS